MTRKTKAQQYPVLHLGLEKECRALIVSLLSDMGTPSAILNSDSLSSILFKHRHRTVKQKTTQEFTYLTLTSSYELEAILWDIRHGIKQTASPTVSCSVLLSYLYSLYLHTIQTTNEQLPSDKNHLAIRRDMSTVSSFLNDHTPDWVLYDIKTKSTAKSRPVVVWIAFKRMGIMPKWWHDWTKKWLLYYIYNPPASMSSIALMDLYTTDDNIVIT